MNSCIIVPSRDRPKNIVDLIHALHETETNSDLVVVVDNDDAKLSDYQTIDGCQLLAISPGSRGVVWPLNQGARTMLELGYRYFVFMGDDHRPRTKHWDKVWRTNLDELGTGIVYGDDLFQSKGLPTQVGMTRNIVEALNGFVPAVFQHLYCDDFWLALGNDLEAIRYLPETVIEHLHPMAEKAEWDDLYREVNLPENYDLGKAQLKDYLASDDYQRLLNNLTIAPTD